MSRQRGHPRRLTVHPAHDAHPKFSPDGKWVAFSSDRCGNPDIFLIPAEGGNSPDDFHNGRDAHLEKAVEILKEEIGKRQASRGGER